MWLTWLYYCYLPKTRVDEEEEPPRRRRMIKKEKMKGNAAYVSAALLRLPHLRPVNPERRKWAVEDSMKYFRQQNISNIQRES